ncbi:MAG: site-2 protease family protein [Clostridia bacterium]|nr:site-2 protease family protein [Clostridia bacterium]
MKHIKVNPWLFLVIAISLLTGNFFSFLVTYLSLLFHELVHLLFLCREKVLLHRIVFEPFGICIETENEPPAGIAVYLSAPFSNLFVAFLLIWGAKNGWFPFYSQWFFSNLLLGGLNLLPCLPLDGGRALFSFLKRYTKEGTAKKIINLISAILSGFLILLGICLLKQTRNNPSLLMIGIFLCYTCLTSNRLMCQKSICEAFHRMESKNWNTPLPVVALVAPKTYPARKILPKFQGECYYTVSLISGGYIIKTLTETQILSKILRSDSEILLKDC